VPTTPHDDSDPLAPSKKIEDGFIIGFGVLILCTVAILLRASLKHRRKRRLAQ